MIKTFRYITFALLVLFTFSGCEDKGAKFANIANSTELQVELQVGVAEEVHSGDEIISESEDAVIELSHAFKDDIKTVTLISGSASLIKGNYEFTQ
jgi:hypothetical protein